MNFKKGLAVWVLLVCCTYATKTHSVMLPSLQQQQEYINLTVSWHFLNRPRRRRLLMTARNASSKQRD
jgi:adenine C2-methylase RlmN of 23S rRNA A2503 and tRNA A37